MIRSSSRPMILYASIVAAALTASVAVAQQAGGSPPPTPVVNRAGDHVLKLTNGGREAVTAIFYAAPGTLNWSDDLLGSQTAGPGRTVTLKIKDPQGACVFDLQFLMSGGANVNRKSVNVCEPPTYSFTP